jgi:hypothetical protein
MPSLAETLKQRREGVNKRGPGGQLTQETPEEIQSLAGQAGLQAPPLTPMGAASIGANADQQKMQGTPAQKQAALSLAQAPVEQGLAATVRRQQARSQMTEQEQQQKEKSQDMQNLGSLGDRVSGFIDTQRQKLQQQAQQATVENTTGQVQVAGSVKGASGVAIAPDKLAEVKPLLQQLRTNPSDPQLLLQVNKALGYDINRQLSPEEVNQLYESATDTIARGAAGSVDDDLTVQDLVAAGDFGYSQDDLSQLLGVPADKLAGMTVGQLRSEIERVGQEEFASAQKLGEQAQSDTLGLAERNLARQAGREASATGVRATEADYSNIEQQIQNADKVQFGGKEYQVDELLQDNTISSVIRDYLDSAPDSPLRTQLEETEPALKEFIQKNQAVLEEANNQLKSGAAEFQKIQEENKALTTNLFGGQKLSDTIASKIIPGWGELQASRIDPESVPLLSYVSKLPEARQQAVANELNTLSEELPEALNELPNLTPAEVASLGIGKGGSNWDTFKNILQTRKRIEQTAPNDYNTLVSMAFEGENEQSLDNKLREGRTLSTLGIPTGLATDIVDKTQLRDQLLKQVQPVGLKQAASGNITAPTKQRLGNPTKPADGTIEQQVLTLARDMAGDGQLDNTETRVVASRLADINRGDTGKTLGALIGFEDLANNPNAKVDRGAVREIRQQLTDKNTNELIDKGFKSGNPSGSAQYLSDLLRQGIDARIANPGLIRDRANSVVQHELNTKNGDEALRSAQKLIQGGDPALVQAWKNNPALKDALVAYANRNAEGNTAASKPTGKQANNKETMAYYQSQYAMHFNEALRHFADVVDINELAR